MDKTLERNLGDLESLLQAQSAAHEQMLALMKQKRAALASADHDQMAELSRQENGKVQAISELEKRRLSMVADITLLLDPRAAAPLRMAELAERLPEPSRGRLLVLRQQLRDRMEAVRKEVSIARQATQTLSRHMQGLVQAIGGVMTGIGTYGRTGAPPRAATAVSTFSATG